MSEADKNAQEQKAKICTLAIRSLLFGLIGFVVVFFLSLFVHGLIVFLGNIIALIGIYCGVKALLEIRRSRGLLKGRLLAVSGIFTCILGQMLGIYFAGLIFFHAHEVAWRKECSTNLKELGIALKEYAENHNSAYPSVNEWCDLLKQTTGVEERMFKCPLRGKYPSSYAMNQNCQPNSPPDMVLLFESKEGWNLSGGPELLSIENHNGQGCTILFNDGHPEFILRETLGKLKWKDGENAK